MNNYHTHTCYCDGANSPEEMVLKAIELGCDELGFSGHSPLPFTNDYAIRLEKLVEYHDKINALKSKYAHKIKIYCGLELDYYGLDGGLKFDYIIGSVHHIIKNGKEFTIDLSKAEQKGAVDEFYGGDYYAFIDDYFTLLEGIYEKTHCTFIGHFDLVKKFNREGDLFDENDPRYINRGKKAIETLVKKPCIFEVNTGAIPRGYRLDNYPADIFIEEIGKTKPLFIVNADAHKVEKLLFDIDATAQKLERAGYKTVKKLSEIIKEI
ncbi:MAG: histidinol-phosphatase [Clostridia bacterium]|nr:histidinol-phosphatase [Clostridia bacterium]